MNTPEPLEYGCCVFISSTEDYFTCYQCGKPRHEHVGHTPEPYSALPAVTVEPLRNAKLIAAAPEMLTALKSFVHRWSFPKKPTGEDLEIYLDEARKAIASAV